MSMKHIRQEIALFNDLIWNCGRGEMWLLILKNILEPKVSADWYVGLVMVLGKSCLIIKHCSWSSTQQQAGLNSLSTALKKLSCEEGDQGEIS